MPCPLLLTFYADDFTGSTDALEALSVAGVRTALFLEPPTPAQLQRFGDLQAAGVAGLSRSMSPDQMDAELPSIFAALKALGAPVTHYKVCSTFDSSPRIGSIGRAIDLGQATFQARFVPLLVGAPPLGRYCAFGNLFARSGGDPEVHRLDRHPTMHCHPITPMDEADLRVVLAEQTTRTVGLFDLTDYEIDDVKSRLEALIQGGAQVVLFDIAASRQFGTIGRMIWSQASAAAPLFAVGSSGIEYAMTAAWRAEGLVGAPAGPASLERADRVLAVSGSCSPVTARQIETAAEHGFIRVAADATRLVDPTMAAEECAVLARQASGPLAQGRSVLIYTAHGPGDPSIVATLYRMGELGFTEEQARVESGRRLGDALGRATRMILEETGVRRVAIAGGDSSSYVARALGIEALEYLTPAAPGSPFCRTHAPGSPADRAEFVFKGGQVGRPDFFDGVRRGRC